MIAGAGYDMLLADLYAGVQAEERFETFLRGLNAASGSHFTVLLRQDAADPSRSCFSTPGMDVGVDASLMASYQSDFASVDDKLWFQRSAGRMQAGAVIDGEEVATKGEIKQTRYYAEILQRLDIMHSVGMCGLLSPAQTVFLTPCRSERAGPYSPDQVALLRQVGAHWANACVLAERFRTLQGFVGQGCSHRRGLFLLDHDLKWVSANEAAEHMVLAGWLHGRRGARLTCTSAATTAAWRLAQRHALDPAAPAQRTVPVYDRSGDLVAFAWLQPYGACTPGDELPAFALFVRSLAGTDEAALARELRSLFSLTPAEARLAVALRRKGDLAHAAADVGITEGSARVRLQSVFDKCGTHRQGELMRMLDALCDATA